MTNQLYKKYFDGKEFQITTDPAKIDVETLFSFLHYQAYWSIGIPKEYVKNSLKFSLNFSLLSPENKFIGFARVVTDYYSFGWLADVYIDEQFRGKGLGKWLVEIVIKHPDLQRLRNFVLFTKDAHELYKKFGWKKLLNPDIVLARKYSPDEIYNAKIIP